MSRAYGHTAYECSPKRRQSVEEKSWSRWRLFGVSDLEACGGGAPVTSRDGGGQVEAEETRVVLMGSYPSTRPAYLMRGPTEVRPSLVWASGLLICLSSL
ncbi:hypothetical protein DY000_02029753 [Brassica cretica]|uniref:Uncharacterized protein n=1 Tax=Brassica cretica TaxID=69181 RepID=A0ABQ7DNG4_BRACR|nr:hypothetical protein DY000_02029753 [Brassica cretica]